jgi:hypothetical protein
VRRGRAAGIGVAVLALVATGVVGIGTPAGGATPRPTDGTIQLHDAPLAAAGAVPPDAADKLAAAPRARVVTLDAATVRAQVDTGRVDLALFPDVVVPLVGDGPVHEGAAGTLTWSGTAPDGGYATLTFSGAAVHGDVFYDGVRYDLAPIGGSTHLVTVEQRDFPDEMEGQVPPGGLPPVDPAAVAGAGDVQASANPVIRVLTWYDAYTSTQFGGNAAAQSEIAATLNEANAAYTRSGIAQSIQSAGIEFVTHTSTGAASTELNRYTNPSDGFLDAVQARRNATGADLVSLVTSLGDACGIAWLPPYLPDASTSEYAYSIVEATCARGTLSFVHELGHNMGAGHGGGNGGGTFSYSNGHTDAVHHFRTIMAYDTNPSCCTRVAHFSSNTVLYNGFSTGSATENNARTLNETGAGIAAYRAAVAPPPANDAFATAIAWTPAAGNPIIGTYAGATKQAGEPDHADAPGGASVWWKYTPSVDTLLTVSTAGSTFDTLLGVYTGSPVSALTKIAANDDAAGTLTSKTQLLADAGTTYSIAVDGYLGATGTISMTITSADPPGQWYHAVSPARIQDSRPTGPQVGPYSTPWGQGTSRTVKVAGVGGVPADAGAVTLNVTVTAPSAASFLTLWPAGQARPLASSLNYTPGQTVPNAVTVKVGTSGNVSVFNAAGTADVIIDVVGYYDDAAGDGYTSLTPARIQDSRPTGPQVGPYATPWGQGTTRTVTAAGAGGVPGGAAAVVVNVTVTNVTGSSFLTIWPSGQARPLASSLNYTPGVTVANAVTVKVGGAGKISVFNAAGRADVIIDVVGYFQPGVGKSFHASTPSRILDSRPGGPRVGPYNTPWSGGVQRTVQAGGSGDVAGNADAVLLNVTATNTTAPSFLTVWPSGQARPLASSLNWAPGATVPNAVSVKLGGQGKTSMYDNAGSVDVIADVAGWYG